MSQWRAEDIRKATFFANAISSEASVTASNSEITTTITCIARWFA
jgi:hypothetical protein